MAGKKRRGISLGTIVMLCLTLVVGGGLAVVMPRLTGSTQVDLDTEKVFGALSLSGVLPELSLSDIPIHSDVTVPTDSAVSSAPQSAETTAPTLPPQQLETAIPQAKGGSFTMTLGGSICLENDVRKSAYVSEAEVYDFSEMISLLTPEMQTDLCMVSLENLVDPSAKLSDTITTDQALPMLTSAGIDAVALGFPKAYDQGMTGLSGTIDALTGRGVTVLGAFGSAEDAQATRLMTLGGVKVAVLHYTDGLSNTGAKKVKKEDAAYAVPQADIDTMLGDIQRVRQAGAEVIVISLHWGSANKTSPTKAQRTLAQQLAAGGADVIVGTGSNTVQTAEWLTGLKPDGSDKQTLCVYSLGSLIQEARGNVNVAAILLQLQIAVDGNGNVTFEKTAYTPTYIWKYKVDGKSHYRVIPSDTAFPADMGSDQQTAATRALKTVQDALAESPLTVR